MKTTFADSFYWLGLINPDDAYHERILTVSQNLTGTILTTEAILIEVADALCRVRFRPLAVQVIQAVYKDPTIRVIPQSSDLFEEAFALFTARPDKDWSLTDCISFVVMQDYSVTDALTGDHHFEQAGFRALLLGENPPQADSSQED